MFPFEEPLYNQFPPTLQVHHSEEALHVTLCQLGLTGSFITMQEIVKVKDIINSVLVAVYLTSNPVVHIKDYCSSQGGLL